MTPAEVAAQRQRIAELCEQHGIDYAEARATAADWHSGQSSPLYAFASSGAIVDGFAAEVDECLIPSEAEDRPALEQLAQLAALWAASERASMDAL